MEAGGSLGGGRRSFGMLAAERAPEWRAVAWEALEARRRRELLD